VRLGGAICGGVCGAAPACACTALAGTSIAAQAAIPSARFEAVWRNRLAARERDAPKNADENLQSLAKTVPPN
ncbi:MAG: hypothetical protein AAFQ90_11280, partial [Pseudomonadota bacterium]